MSEMIKLYGLQPLTSSMKRKHVDMNQFSVTYNDVEFDVIYDVGCTPFELLIGAKYINLATTVQIKKGYTASMNDSDFYRLCTILNLKPGKNLFTSFTFLRFIASNAPKDAKDGIISSTAVAKFRHNKIPIEQEKDKIYFIGWNNHKKDGRIARNFEKTELLLGSSIANYCRKHNISSMWSNQSSDKQKETYPWKM